MGAFEPSAPCRVTAARFEVAERKVCTSGWRRRRKSRTKKKNHGRLFHFRPDHRVCCDCGVRMAVLAIAAAEWPDVAEGGGVGKTVGSIGVRRAAGTRR